VRNQREWITLKTAPNSVQRAHELPIAVASDTAVTNGNGRHLWTVKSSHPFSARNLIGSLFPESTSPKLIDVGVLPSLVARIRSDFSFVLQSKGAASIAAMVRASSYQQWADSLHPRSPFSRRQFGACRNIEPPSLLFPSISCSFRSH
jgi:hypothetical protein